MRIPKEKIDEIRKSVDIVDVISDYLPLTKRGKNYFGICPFHEDHNPSMSVSNEKQIYTCFVCGATGNVFKFIMDYENISFLESVKRVADKTNILLDVNINYNKAIKKNSLYDIYELASKVYQNNINLETSKNAREYLKSRFITDDIIKEFKIGLSLKDRNVISKILREKSFNKEDILKSGLLIQNEYGISDIFYDRIMFPLWDIDGQVVGFSGRIYQSDSPSKYTNTKETEIFKKGELLYNYHRAKNEARASGKVLVMEGFMDAISTYSNDIKYVVATMGTAVTKFQANLLKKMAKEVILCFDGDEAGAKATLSCGNILLDLGVTPKVIRLEDNMDPYDYIKKYGKEEFLNRVNNPISIMDFKINYLKKNKDLNSSTDMASYVNEVIKELNSINDPVLREISIKKISKESNLDIDFLKGQLKNLEVKPIKLIIPVQKKYNKYEKAEQYLIYYMLKSPVVIKMYQNKVTYLPTERYRFLARDINCYYDKYKSIEIADLMSFLESEQSTKTLGEIVSLNLKDEFSNEEIDDYINVIYDFNYQKEIRRINLEIRKTSDLKKQAAFAEELLNLRKRCEDERN
jgi:DNA primase